MDRSHDTIRIEDYKLEELLRMPLRSEAGHYRGRSGHVDWRQLAQYAASHCVNDFYSLPLEARTQRTLAELVERRWTNRHYRFLSNEHFWQTKTAVERHLASFLLEKYRDCRPIVLFEQLSTYIKELGMELSQIFQLIVADKDALEHSDAGYTVQKYMVDENEAAVSAFIHMTTVFCANAFGALPSRIEALFLLSGKRHVYYPDESSWTKSLDYMRLAASLLPQAHQEHAGSKRAMKLIM